MEKKEISSGKTMKVQDDRTEQAIDALRWIVNHLDFRPELRYRLDLITEDERKSLRLALEHAENGGEL